MNTTMSNLKKAAEAFMTALVAVFMSLFTTTASTEARIAELEKQVKQLVARIDELEQTQFDDATETMKAVDALEERLTGVDPNPDPEQNSDEDEERLNKIQADADDGLFEDEPAAEEATEPAAPAENDDDDDDDGLEMTGPEVKSESSAPAGVAALVASIGNDEDEDDGWEDDEDDDDDGLEMTNESEPESEPEPETESKARAQLKELGLTAYCNMVYWMHRADWTGSKFIEVDNDNREQASAIVARIKLEVLADDYSSLEVIPEGFKPGKTFARKASVGRSSTAKKVAQIKGACKGGFGKFTDNDVNISDFACLGTWGKHSNGIEVMGFTDSRIAVVSGLFALEMSDLEIEDKESIAEAMCSESMGSNAEKVYKAMLSELGFKMSHDINVEAMTKAHIALAKVNDDMSETLLSFQGHRVGTVHNGRFNDVTRSARVKGIVAASNALAAKQ